MPRVYSLLDDIDALNNLERSIAQLDPIKDKVGIAMKTKTLSALKMKYPQGVQVDLLTWQTTPGGQVMRAFNGRQGSKPDLEALLDCFCEVFHTGNRWTWIGRGYVAPNEVLDGNGTTGECACLANAFRRLAMCGNGLGLTFTNAQVGDVVTYEGKNRQGFISGHGAGSALGLPANVYPLTSAVPSCPPSRRGRRTSTSGGITR